MSRDGYDAGAIARMLSGRIRSLAAELLPAGQKDGHEWRCGSLRGERGQSLAVRLSGERAGVWADFSTGETGDALDLVAQVRFAGDRGAALKWARVWLGISSDRMPGTRQAPPPPPEAASSGSRHESALSVRLARTDGQLRRRAA